MDNSSQIKSSIYLTLKTNKGYLEAVSKLFDALKGPNNISAKDYQLVKKEFSELQESSIRLAILIDAFSKIIDEPKVLEEVGYTLDFIKYAKHITESLTNNNYFEIEMD